LPTALPSQLYCRKALFALRNSVVHVHPKQTRSEKKGRKKPFFLLIGLLQRLGCLRSGAQEEGKVSKEEESWG
jgi:hypothetical protein